MSRFNKENFGQIIRNIEKQQLNNDDAFWVSVGILEKMYDDDYGYIDQYFHSQYNSRNWSLLWDNLQDQLKNNFDR